MVALDIIINRFGNNALDFSLMATKQKIWKNATYDLTTKTGYY